MIIKKFQAQTETEAIVLAKNELGKDAIVMNIKTIAPKGIYRLFKKSVVEVTAAIDENSGVVSGKNDLSYINNGLLKKISGEETEGLSNDSAKEESAIEQKLNALQALIEKQLEDKQLEDGLNRKKNPNNQIEQENHFAKDNPLALDEHFSQDTQYDGEGQVDLSLSTIAKDVKQNGRKPYLDLVYNQLIKNEVDEVYVTQIINELDSKYGKETPIDNILSNVYQKIILKLGQPKGIEVKPDCTKFIFFIGPTGVGKTTTIAKIASDFKLNQKVKVAMLTSDTYRIAAVEQLRTYANILSIPMKVIYTEEEMEEARRDFYEYDIILVDTAGRSHKNAEQKDDLTRLINTIPKEEREIYLVLSATTKYKDLVRITESYNDFTEYRLIFTKLDETISVGNIFNIKMLTSKELSYTTSGQNVPDDISKIDTQETAKKLLGGND